MVQISVTVVFIKKNAYPWPPSLCLTKIQKGIQKFTVLQNLSGKQMMMDCRSYPFLRVLLQLLLYVYNIQQYQLLRIQFRQKHLYNLKQLFIREYLYVISLHLKVIIIKGDVLVLSAQYISYSVLTVRLILKGEAIVLQFYYPLGLSFI